MALLDIPDSDFVASRGRVSKQEHRPSRSEGYFYEQIVLYEKDNNTGHIKF